MTRDEVLSPCPFCSESEHVREKCGSDVFYACTNCGAGGPLGSTEEAAAVAWNNAHLPPANIGADSPSDVHALILRIIPAIVNGLWDARDSGEEVSEIKPFIDRDAAVIVRYIRVALGAPTMVPDATPAEGGSDG